MRNILSLAEQQMLLGRPVEPLLTAADRAPYAGRRCLVTGAGGSVGSELARQLAACEPAALTLVDHSEHALFLIEQELAEFWPGVSVQPVLGDVTRQKSMRHLFKQARPHIVFHAAAYKHVTMAERAACAAANVNVLGTETVLAAALETRARFVLISSDKAASPLSVMGATKRLAEIVTQRRAAHDRRCTVVRFGNVLASSGSFVDVMLERLQRGLPLIVTDLDATRYFMTVTEAAALVMKTAELSRGDETFWLDMGEPVRIGDLADRLIGLAVARGCRRVPMEVVGLRPGEKLVEQLTAHGLAMTRTDHPRIWVARESSAPGAALSFQLRLLKRHLGEDDALGVLKVLAAAVRGFEPSAHAWSVARAERLYRGTRSARARTA